LASDILSSKKLEITPISSIILLLSPACTFISAKVNGIDLSRFVVLR
jgi:hypothetical protein